MAHADEALFDGSLDVDYGFALLYSVYDGIGPDLTSAIAGQQNGLCGAASPRVLVMAIGLRTGSVPFRVELHATAPPLPEGWEDIVEVSFTPSDRALLLAGFDSSHDLILPAVRTYRARYCANGMGAADQQESRGPGDPVLDRYLLVLWPAHAAPDQIVRVGSSYARHRHGEAQGRSRPRSAAVAASSPARQWWLRYGAQLGIPEPDDPDLAQLLDTADDSALRGLAIWAATWACERDVSGAIDWEPVLHGLRHNVPCPPPFDRRPRAWWRVAPAHGEGASAEDLSPGSRSIHDAARIAVSGAIQHNPVVAARWALAGAASAPADPSQLYRAAKARLAGRS